jgi:proteasome lid subunit RPN8/RPN11
MSALTLDRVHYQTMLEHVLQCLPEEACGLVGGTGSRARIVLPIMNQLHSRERFEMEPREQIKALGWLEEHGLEVVAIFHSHPRGPQAPSQTDIENFNYSPAATLIWALKETEWQVQGFSIIEKQASPLQLIWQSYEQP